MLQQRVEGVPIQGHQRNRKEKLVLWKLASMPDTENCGRISKKDSKSLVCGSSCRCRLTIIIVYGSYNEARIEANVKIVFLEY